MTILSTWLFVCVIPQDAAATSVVSCSQEKEGPPEKNRSSPVHSERDALLVGTLIMQSILQWPNKLGISVLLKDTLIAGQCGRLQLSNAATNYCTPLLLTVGHPVTQKYKGVDITGTHCFK